MLYLKRLDLFIQLLLPIFGTFTAVYSNFWMGFYIGATGIAFSQIMSLFLHLPAKKEFWYLKTARRWYSYVLIAQLVLEISGLIVFFLTEDATDFEDFFISSCIIIGTILTVFYWLICSIEIHKIHKKKRQYSN